MLVDPRTFRRVVRIREMLLASNDDTPLAELAAREGLTATRLIRIFAALHGTTPHQARTEARLERARRLLMRGECVTSVCMEVGFSSLGSFSALFTRWTGTAPSRYRHLAQVGAELRAEPIVPGCLGMIAAWPRSNFREASPP